MPADLDSRLNAPEARPIVKHLGDQRVKDSGKGDLWAVDQFDAQRGGADRRQFLDQDCGISGFRFHLRRCGQGGGVAGSLPALAILLAGECGPVLGLHKTLGDLQGAIMRYGDDAPGPRQFCGIVGFGGVPDGVNLLLDLVKPCLVGVDLRITLGIGFYLGGKLIEGFTEAGKLGLFIRGQFPRLRIDATIAAIVNAGRIKADLDPFPPLNF